MDIIKERYDIAINRIKEIKDDNAVEQKYYDYFVYVSQFILMLDENYGYIQSEKIKDYSEKQLQDLNKKLYQDIYSENYAKSYANPEYAVKVLGETYGKILCYVYAKLRSQIRNIYKEEAEIFTLYIELFIEIYNYFEESENPEVKYLEETIYSFEKDNSEIFMDKMIDERVNPENKFAVNIVMDSDLNDLRYLYLYGEHIGNNEIEMAKFLNRMDDEEVKRLATVYTEGYKERFIHKRYSGYQI